MNRILIALCAAVCSGGCATTPPRFSSATFAVEVPIGWKQPETSQRDGVTGISLTKELSKTAFVRVQCDRYPASERPAIETLAAQLEEAGGLKRGTTDRVVASVLGLKGSGLQRTAMAKDDESKRFNYLVFLPDAASRLPNCVLLITSTGINAETDVDRVIRSLELTTAP